MALVSQAVAEPLRQPYKPTKLVKMSTRALFGGLDRRQEGYSPEQEICGTGNTCAEACGEGYDQCTSSDDVIHCYDKGGKQTCCPQDTGDSCDDGYFCSSDEAGATWCCPDSMTLQECAKAYNLPGSLVSETTASATASTSAAPVSSTIPSPASTTPASATPSSSSPITTSTSTSTSSSSSASVVVEANPTASSGAADEEEEEDCTTFTSPIVHVTTLTAVPSLTSMPPLSSSSSYTSLILANSTLITPTAETTSSEPTAVVTSTTSSFVTAGGNSVSTGPVAGAVLLAAGLFAALL
ncbi:hypothetical protein F4778DRAFT_784955 [Xylariomycetidae sp. FL2044]|nr:hypothetical protein F4778DRAFT_784955 [Xylariomycetidae sp. FL2044]